MICWGMFGSGVADWYDEEYYTSSPPADPPGPSEASSRVIRGGGWSTARQALPPGVPQQGSRRGTGDYDLGFRVAAVQE